MDNILFSHSKDDWRTPKDLFNKLNEEFYFTLDAAASNENHLCDKYFTEEQDALKQSWSGEVVFINPPYSQWKKFVQKAWKESNLNNTVVLLLPSRTDVKVQHEFIFGKCKTITFLKTRLKFSESKNPAPFPSQIVVYSKNITDNQLNLLNTLGYTIYE